MSEMKSFTNGPRIILQRARISCGVGGPQVTYVTGKINVRMRSDARPVTFGMSTWLALSASR